MSKKQLETLHEEFLSVLNALNEVHKRLGDNKTNIPASAPAERTSFSTLKQNVKEALAQLEHAATHPGESVADFVYLIASLMRLEDAIYSLEKYARSQEWRKLSRICIVLRRTIEYTQPEEFDDIGLKAILEIGEEIITAEPTQIDTRKCASLLERSDLTWLPPIDYKEVDLYHREGIN